ncbi:MAG: hypothetical protein Aurels2KO_52870 [Aureliella sp.]
MNDSFFWYMFKRVATILALVGAFCMLPGPRRLLGNALGALFTPEAQNSLWAGFHLSMIHLCWLFDLKMQLLPYADSVDPLLANIACLFGILLQVAVAAGAWMLSTAAFLYYDPERPTEELDDGDEELSVAPPELGSELQIGPSDTPRVRVG